jgi:hypothetical protein
MRPNAIAVGFLVLLAVFAGIAYIQIALLTIGVLVCVVIGYGFLRGDHRRRTVRLPAESRSGGDEPQSRARKSVQIEGRKFELDAMPASLDLAIARRNNSVVGGIIIIAVGAVLASLFSFPTQHIDVENPRFFLFYALCILVALLLIPSFMWAGECTLMKTPGITLAAVYSRGSGILGTKWLSYGFTDSGGGHLGGSAIDFGGPEGVNLKFVFCDPRDPSRNKLSCGLLFCRILWAEA